MVIKLYDRVHKISRLIFWQTPTRLKYAIYLFVCVVWCVCMHVVCVYARVRPCVCVCVCHEDEEEEDEREVRDLQMRRANISFLGFLYIFFFLG